MHVRTVRRALAPWTVSELLGVLTGIAIPSSNKIAIPIRMVVFMSGVISLPFCGCNGGFGSEKKDGPLPVNG